MRVIYQESVTYLSFSNLYTCSYKCKICECVCVVSHVMLVHHRRIIDDHLIVLVVHPGIRYRLDDGTATAIYRTYLPLLLLLLLSLSLLLSIDEMIGTALAPPLHCEGVGIRPRRPALPTWPNATGTVAGITTGTTTTGRRRGIEGVRLFVVHVRPLLVDARTNVTVVGRRRVSLLSVLVLMLTLVLSGSRLVRTMSVQRRRTNLDYLGGRVSSSQLRRVLRLPLLVLPSVFYGILRCRVARRRRRRGRVVRQVPRRMIQLPAVSRG
mmetsp:Transcript_24527/g.44226  ORF Transcript_24527/g.44226 Transcript_24527/m.44226 type:complete len:267 (+) Transcript_24527:245-1045(+)